MKNIILFLWIVYLYLISNILCHKPHENDDIAPCYKADNGDFDSIFEPSEISEVPLLYRKYPFYNHFNEKFTNKYKYESYKNLKDKYFDKTSHKFNDRIPIKDKFDKFSGKDERKQLLQATYASKHKIEGRIPVIIDTDIGMFPDDPVALAIMHQLQAQGKIQILAIVGNTKYDGIARNIQVINDFMNHSNILIGTTKDPKAFSDPEGSQEWSEYVKEEFYSTIQSNDDVPEAVDIYRIALAMAPDKSVIILSLGHLTNLANLLNTKSDKFSKLNGRSLIKKKVREVFVMGGQFPDGYEWNILKDVHSARHFGANWPGKVTYIGSELGNVTCGTKYQQMRYTSIDNPISVMTLFGVEKFGTFWGCYDAVAALIAGQEISSFYCAVYGNIQVDSYGTNRWVHSPKTSLRHNSQRYLQLKAGNNDLKTRLFISKRIDDFLPEINV